VRYDQTLFKTYMPELLHPCKRTVLSCAQKYLLASFKSYSASRQVCMRRRYLIYSPKQSATVGRLPDARPYANNRMKAKIVPTLIAVFVDLSRARAYEFRYLRF